jgi:hypothetical protein
VEEERDNGKEKEIVEERKRKCKRERGSGRGKR